MREIIFRGKRKDNGNWINGSFHTRANESFIIPLPIVTSQSKVIPETVGQFTGLTDKNGKKIFEGDIIRAKIESGNHEGFIWENMPIDFQKGSFCLTNRTGNVFCVLGAFASSVSLEVIGNIHDNPELLENITHQSQ